MEMDFHSQYSVETAFNSPDYELLEKIGEGGFGQVYKAIQHSTQKFVAIKFLTISAAFDKDKARRYIERFNREADLIRRLNHPNIVNLVDKGQQGDSLIYAVYEYIDGRTLKEHIEIKGALNPVDTAEIMACVLDALSHAHEKGVIHRDIKPSNIMLYKVGAKIHVKVLDFGIATLNSDFRQLDYKSITLTQETLGTPTYSSPEQLRGEPPIAQTDIYVWGLVFLECLTGVPTITGRSLAAIFHQQLSPTNIPLGVLAGHSSSQLFRRVLNKKPQERPLNTAELYHEFRKLNFSNLVCKSVSDTNYDVEGERTAAPSTSQYDETLINDGNFSYSRLTERKQITVLSVILSSGVINTQHQTAHFIEQDVIDTFHSDQLQQSIDIASRYGAVHVGTLGDTLLFYFGYPSVTDNDSRLCSRAALEIASNIKKKNALLKGSHGIVSQIQMGIQIGLMQSLIGHIPEGKVAHDAMKFSRIALPGQIVCSENVKQLLESHLNFERLIGGEKESACEDCFEQRMYLLRSERLSEAFGFLRSTRKNHAFIGRETEVSVLDDLLSCCDAKKFAYIEGEAGIGKSRLLFELRERKADWRHLVGQCLPEHQNNALFPILNMLKAKYALEPLNDGQRLDRLNQAIDILPLPQEHKLQGLVVLALWLNLEVDGCRERAYILGNLSPALQKQRLFEILAYLLCQVRSGISSNIQYSKHHLFIFEDLHWADPTSVEFIKFIAESDSFNANEHAWFNTSREPLPSLLGGTSFVTVHLERLDHMVAMTFVNSLFDQQILSSRLKEFLNERADGIPLFIEELVLTLQEQKLVRKVNGTVDLVNEHNLNQIPATLRELLHQKLDRLRYAKPTAQLAATIGRAFDYDLLVLISGKDEAEIQVDLEELVKAELVYPQRQIEGDKYLFKHALVRDTAYESMDKKTLQNAHLRIAEVLVNNFPDRVSEQPGEVAEHFARASQYELAIEFGTSSANASLASFAIEETIEQSQRVCCWIEKVSPPATVVDKIEINRILLQALMLKLGWGHQQVYERIDKTKSLFAELTPSQYSRSVVWSLVSTFVYYFVVGQKDGMVSLHNHLKGILKNKNDPDMALAAYIMQGFIFFNEAEFERAKSAFLKVVNLYNDKEHQALIYLYGLDLYTWAQSILGIVYSYQGHNNLAEASGIKAVKWAREIEHVPSICIALLYKAIVAQFNADKLKVKRYSEEIITLSDSYNLPAYKGYASLLNLWSLDLPDVDTEASIVKALREMNCNAFIPYYGSLHADTLIRNGQTSAAIKLIDECLISCEKFNDYSYEAELYKRRANCFLQQDIPDYSRASSDLKHAIKLAELRGNSQTLQQSKHYLLQLKEQTH
ncbi:TOMM system kinase/cyclase fusion protein [Photobacterium gaetbulicola]|uniref:Putative serine/threonine protein kinase n=1 Tax=Photobacterium gaetbulicola Gung47 TaxID=658445 RepID=A0A0C5WQ57_9GAMM|nr:TOMM system kinase/cyclase fusion protein [Photobacterium gaetbulicola]AJR08507.1 putative serine/threonine protein kinase [Photobacterium gaetbulicola Gung47]PSU03316.1 TOMM system kinase/cyclase fusion protein [Photobacterium gaetbulicola]